jgi:hypothetical protein
MGGDRMKDRPGDTRRRAGRQTGWVGGGRKAGETLIQAIARMIQELRFVESMQRHAADSFSADFARRRSWGTYASPSGIRCGNYKAVERRLLAAIHLRFALPPEPPAAVTTLAKKADRVAACFEAVELAVA